MKFYKPQLQLAYRVIANEDGAFINEYILHAVTFCRRTNFRADGYTVAPKVVDNKLLVTLKLKQEPELPDLEYITPVVHTIRLGSFDFIGGEGFIEVEVQASALVAETGAIRSKNAPAERTKTTGQAKIKTGGKSGVSTADADGKSRPDWEKALF